MITTRLGHQVPRWHLACLGFSQVLSGWSLLAAVTCNYLMHLTQSLHQILCFKIRVAHQHLGVL